ncbi:hypothetical protein JTE90_005925 [Oedothorax gibbosus]|uniref:PPM-type phosphatase domain-containing protein n=1 Tax=Oedothorax gibbosus TaxID=931172 RepID=A0AAV6U9G1_9ARAC|nr:hypothetical protein JTE90_005925 [Oedothorax gibbosus]
MEDDSEDFYQALTRHLRLFSSVLWTFPVRHVSGLFGTEGAVGSSKLEISLSVFAIATFLLVLYQSVELVRRMVLARALLRARRGRSSLPLFPRERDCWELEQGPSCGLCALKGRRPRMEDRFSIIEDPASGIALYGVFDGHGGEFAADFVEKRLFKELLKKLQAAVLEKGKGSSCVTEEFVRLLTAQILDLDKELLLKVKAARDVAGTTALVAIVYKNKLIVANVGDSRGVICDSKGNTIPLSFDHKPDQLKERKRIKDAGGFIAYNGVWRVAGILATSRALGDFPLKDRNLVIARPDILTFDLATLRPRFMILASDGLWDTMSNEEAVAHLVKDNGHRALEDARSLSHHAFKSGSQDNVTVLVVRFSEEKKEL